MDAPLLTFVFLMVGFLLLGAELFLPSGGIIGVLCAASFGASIYFAYRAWYVSNPVYWRIYLSVMVILIPVTISGVYQLLTRTSFGNRFLLAAPSTEEVTPYQEEQARLRSLIGQRGKALNLMTPGGLVVINGERLHAIGQNMMIEAGTPIEVVEIQGTRVIVRIVTQDSSSSVAEEVDTEALIDEEVANKDEEDDLLDPFLPPEQS